MATKEELQDEADELRLELERTRDVAESELGELRSEASGLREEVRALRGELSASESRRRQLQGELNTLNETSNNSRELYREKEERLLAGVKEAAAAAAAAYKRWEAREAHLKGELTARDTTVRELQRKVSVQQEQLQRQGVWMVETNGRLKAAEGKMSIQAQTIRTQESQIARHGEAMREAIEQSESMVIGLLKLIIESPRFWVFLLCLSGIGAAIAYMFNSAISFLTRSQNLLGQ